MNLSRFDRCFLAVGALGLSATGCFALNATCLATNSCIPERASSVPIRRASKEFECPSEKIVAIERDDISGTIYDVSACGARARYTCVYGSTHHPATTCIREPDPPRWDPDPIVIAAVSRPTETGFQPVRSGYAGPICGNPTSDDCFYRDQGTWQWRHLPRHPCGGGFSGVEMMTCP